MLQVLWLRPMTVHWTNWYRWADLRIDARSSPNAPQPPNRPGVYEAKVRDATTRLTIGKASNLRMRVKQGLVKGKTRHSSGDDIRAGEDMSKVLVRWALTDRPAAVEEELHRLYKHKHKRLPKYTDVT